MFEVKGGPTCAHCKAELPISRLLPDKVLPCGCGASNHVAVFAAFVTAPEQASPGSETMLVEGASCFSHPAREAIIVCADCGKYVCALCEVKAGNKSQCLDCFSRDQSEATATKMMRWDTLALYLSVAPIIFFWITAITAPAALGLAIFAWTRRNRGIFPLSRSRIILAMLLALVQISLWIFVIPAWMELLNEQAYYL